MNIFKALARAFTIPRAIRNKLNANPLAGFVKASLAETLGNAVHNAVDQHVKDQATAEAVKAALDHAIDMTGVLK